MLRRTLYRLGVIPTLMLLFSSLFVTPTYAKSSNDAMSKITAKNTQSAIRIFEPRVKPIFLKDNKLPFENSGQDCTVPMPNTIIKGSAQSSPKMSCYDFLLGNDKWSGVMNKPNLSGDNPATYGSYLESIGYQRIHIEGSSVNCLYATVSNRDMTDSTGGAIENISTSNKVCADVYEDTINSFNLSGDSNNSSFWFKRDVNGSSYSAALYRENSVMIFIDGVDIGSTKWSKFVQDWQNAASDWNNNGTRTSINIQTTEDLSNGNEDITWETEYEKTSVDNIMNKILGSSTVNTLSVAEVYNIYAQYLTDANHVKISCSDLDYSNDNAFNWMQVNIKREDKIDNNCYVHEEGTMLYTGATSGRRNGFYFTRENMTLSDIVNQINSFDLEAIIDDINNIDETDTNDLSDSDSTEGDPCYNAGVESMSWILCPALNNTNQTVDAIEGQLREWLQIKTSGDGGIFQNENGNNIYKGWDIFRNISNVLLIIIFLVIVFSQLTGVGIDNYGIKKMLPRLIIMAILINLSYVICQLAVDLSNILGVGLDNLMKGIGFSINGGNDPSAGFTLQTIASTLLGAAAVGGVVVGLIGTSGGGVMAVVSLLLAALVALVAVLMFFIMLSARMVIVAVFVVIAPVALALYILPNTQNLYKKWWKIFEAALVVYPICGALYGASYIIKAIVRPDNMANLGFFQGMIGAVAPFLPFLILPSLLKSALAGLGAIGGALTMLGSGLRKGLASGKGAIENTKAYKGAQERAADRSAERRARRIRDRLQRANSRRGGTDNDLSRLSESQRRRLYQANTLLNERTQQRAQDTVGAFALDTSIAQSRAEAARDAQEYKAFQDQFANPNFNLANEAANASGPRGWYNPTNRASQQRMRALVGAMESRGMEGQIFTMLRNNDINRDDVTMSALADSSNKVLKAYGKKGQGVSYDDFMNGTGGQNAASMQKYIQSKGEEFVNGLDDKALEEISRHNNGAAINDDILNKAVTSLKDADALRQARAIIRHRLSNGQAFSIKGEYLTEYDDDTFGMLASYSNGRQALVQASDNLSSKQIEKLNSVRKRYINQQRSQNGRQPIP